MKWLFFFLVQFICLLPVANADFSKKIYAPTATAITFDAQQDCYLVTYLTGPPFRANGSGYIQKIHPDLVEVITAQFCVGLDAPNDLLFALDYLVVADLASVKFFNRRSGELIKGFCYGEAPYTLISGLCFDGQQFLYACDMLGQRLIQFDLLNDFKPQTVYQGIELQYPKRLVWDSTNKMVLVGSKRTGRIIEFHPQSKSLKTRIPLGPKNLSGLALDGQGNLFVSSQDRGGWLYQIQPNQSLSSIHQELVDPVYLYLDPARKRLIVPIGQSNELITLDLDQYQLKN